MHVFRTMAITLGVSGLIELLIGAFGYTEGSIQIWRIEPSMLTMQTVSLPVWIGCFSVLFGASMLVVTQRPQ